MYPLRNWYLLCSLQIFFLCSAEIDLLILMTEDDFSVPLICMSPRIQMGRLIKTGHCSTMCSQALCHVVQAYKGRSHLHQNQKFQILSFSDILP